MADPVSSVAIRRYRLDDAATVFEAVRESIAEVHPWMAWCHAGYAIDESQSWLGIQVPAFDQGTAFEFAIVSEQDRYVGGCGLNQIDHANRRANLGYWIRSSQTRRGAATSAVRMLRDWAFEHTNLIRLEILIAAGNAASHRVAEKAGAVREGTLRSRLLLYGTAHDASIFSLTRAVPATKSLPP